MDPFRMAELVLGDTKLTPGQLAQLRAINTKYFTELYALQQKAGAEGGAPEAAPGSLADGRPGIPEADLAALETVIARDIRDMLTEDQRAVLDRNWPRLRERAIEQPVSDERAGLAPPRGAPPSAAPGRAPAPDASDELRHDR
jgi:hypothetical protein